MLTEAAINGKVDYLRGLKENVDHGPPDPGGHRSGILPEVKIAGEDVVEEEPIQEEPLSTDLSVYAMRLGRFMRVD